MKMNCNPKIQKIDTWYSNGWLSDAFLKGIGTFTEGQLTDFLFADIWAPTAVVNETTHAPIDNEWEWKNYGFDAEEIALIYWSQYGGNYFPERFDSTADFNYAVWEDKCKVIKLIKATIKKNRLKYAKLIELAGFAYNPLNNVDAHEMYSTFENHGGETHGSSGSNSSTTTPGTTNTHSVNPYDTGTPLKVEYTDSQSGSIGVSGINSQTTTITHASAKNTDSAGEQEDYTVNAEDNAFGQALKGADYYKAEKHRRFGNIGTTKTQELLEAEREQLKFNLLQAFFNDLNEVALIGIY